MKKILFLIISICGFNYSYSCSCASQPSVEENWKSSSQVFLGEVTKVDSLIFTTYGRKLYSFTIKILKTYKEEVFPKQEFRTFFSDGGGGSCQYTFLVGEKYLIYANSFMSPGLSSSICSRTNFVKNIDQSEFKLIEKLYRNYDGKSDVYNYVSEKEIIINSYEKILKTKSLIIYILLGIVLILLVILIRRKK